jgi:hypothetical protein
LKKPSIDVININTGRRNGKRWSVIETMCKHHEYDKGQLMIDEHEVAFVVNRMLFKRRPKNGAWQRFVHDGVTMTIKKARLNPRKHKYETYTYGEDTIKETHFAKQGQYSHLSFENGMEVQSLKYTKHSGAITDTMTTVGGGGVYIILCKVNKDFVDIRCDDSDADSMEDSVQMVLLRNGRFMADHLRRNGNPISLVAKKMCGVYIDEVFKIYKI